MPIYIFCPGNQRTEIFIFILLHFFWVLKEQIFLYILHLGTERTNTFFPNGFSVGDDVIVQIELPDEKIFHEAHITNIYIICL
jgi:hypothetical protein